MSATGHRNGIVSRVTVQTAAIASIIVILPPLVSLALDLNQDYRTFSPSGATDRNPYDIAGVGNSDPGSYLHTRWGVYQDEAEKPILGKSMLSFSPLTEGPYSYRNKDLFVSSSISHLLRLALPIEAPSSTEAVWSAPVESSPGAWDDGSVEYYLRTDNEYLFRKLHYQVNGALLDQASGQQIDSTTKKLVILIHGWNRTAQSDQFASGDLANLSTQLSSRLGATDWSFTKYHWERDAETGNLDLTSAGLASPFINATEAAEIAYTHGLHLGELLLARCPDIESVHFIAHSAGSWVAHGAAKHLLENHSDPRIQVTLLDPFIPGSENWPEIPDTRLDAVQMAFTLGLLANGTPDYLWLFENYYAIDDMATLHPSRAAVRAAEQPEIPPPITTTSKVPARGGLLGRPRSFLRQVLIWGPAFEGGI